MHIPTNRFGLHSVQCRFCNSLNTVRAGSRDICAECGKVLNSPVKTNNSGATIYLRKNSASFAQFCEDNWITWADCRNVDGYVWFKEERDVWNALASLGLHLSFSEYSPHFHGHAWILAVDGPLDNILARRNEGLRLKDAVIYPTQGQINSSISGTVSANATPVF